MKNKFHIDFNDLCRFCLTKVPELRPIFDCDVDIPCRIESCVGLKVVQCDPGPSRMCIDCLNHLENWEEFKRKCISSSKCIQDIVKQLDEKKSNSTVDESVVCHEQQVADKQDDTYVSTFSNKFYNQQSDDDSSKSKLPGSITIREVCPRDDKQNEKVFEVTMSTKSTSSKKHYKCGMCFTDFTEKQLLYNHLNNFHHLEENITPHYCLICSKGYCNFKFYQDHLIAEQNMHGNTQAEDKIMKCVNGCGLCTYKFSRSASLYRHLRIHALKKDLMPYLCSICQVGYIDTYSLYLHATIEHNAASVTEIKKECFDSNNISTTHLKPEDSSIKSIDNNNVSNRSNDNNYTITTKRKIKKLKTLEDKRAKYREHYRRFQSKIYTCEFCDVSYSRFCDLSNHDRTTHDDMPKEFSCPTCGKLFLTESRLQIHQNAFHAEKTFSCDICNVRCKSKHTMRTHMRKHSGIFTCSFCNLTTASNAALISHVRIHTGEKPFVCDLCGNSYASKLGLTSHKRIHRQEALFKCNICGYTGSSHSSIYIHKQTHNSDKPFVCDVCGKAFKIKVRLVDHQKIHFASKNFVCEVCNKAFLARYQLVQHSRTHSGEKPFHCHLCSKAFARRDGLSEHIRTHTGEKRYTCSECFGTFSFYKSMKNHKCSATSNDNRNDKKEDDTLSMPSSPQITPDSCCPSTSQSSSNLSSEPPYFQVPPAKTQQSSS